MQGWQVTYAAVGPHCAKCVHAISLLQSCREIYATSGANARRGGDTLRQILPQLANYNNTHTHAKERMQVYTNLRSCLLNRLQHKMLGILTQLQTHVAPTHTHIAELHNAGDLSPSIFRFALFATKKQAHQTKAKQNRTTQHWKTSQIIAKWMFRMLCIIICVGFPVYLMISQVDNHNS